MTTELDESWAELARDTREALRLLGYRIKPVCLPDEDDPCGANFALHVASHLALIQVVIDHHAEHLGDKFRPVIEEIRDHARHEIGCAELSEQQGRPANDE